jgi:hypothetical protein
MHASHNDAFAVGFYEVGGIGELHRRYMANSDLPVPQDNYSSVSSVANLCVMHR